MGRFLGIVCALLLHAAVLLFGGLLLPHDGPADPAVKEVDLLAADEPQQKPQEKADPPPEPQDAAEPPPDAEQLLQDLKPLAPDDAPALDAASLGALDAALSGLGSGGDFAAAASLTSGGRIGGTGLGGGGGDDPLARAFSMAEIDQKPRPVFQVQPLYPAELRGKHVEGRVTVLFVVDPTGKVVEPRIEKASHKAFERPALDAVRQWRFEPAVRGGQRVSCRMRAPLRFQPS